MKENKIPIFNYDMCIACGICVTACPISVLELNKIDIDIYKTAYPSLINDECLGCGICVESCPMDAINLNK